MSRARGGLTPVDFHGHMSPLTDSEKKRLMGLIEEGKPLPSSYKSRLFESADEPFNEPTKEYQLVYEGKTAREEIIANTPAARLQLVRQLNDDNPFSDGWRNLLIHGDNSLALKEIYLDQRGPNRYGTRDRIKLIYIDPPFATKQDFMKDQEKAYCDKILGAEFLEFLRRRLILLYEILADDGTIYVHLDWKKGHYIKAILDEVFGEHNFVNEIIWHYFGFKRSTCKNFPRKHDTIFVYGKSSTRTWHPVFRSYSKEYLERWKVDEEGELYRDDVNPTGGGVRTIYLRDLKGDLVESVWNDIPPVNPVASERTDYPTQKPELLIERMIKASANKGDIVLDAFAGSGTTLAVAEKMGLRWIGIDSGKLAIDTIQERILKLTTRVGSGVTDDRAEHERVEDFDSHLRVSPGALLITDKARNGECEVTLELLQELAEIIKCRNLIKRSTPFSIVCPENKLRIPKSRLAESNGTSKAGQHFIDLNGVQFLISLIAPRQRAEKEKPLKARAFAVFSCETHG